MGTRAPCVYDPLGYTLVIKMGYFFTQNEVFQQRGAPVSIQETDEDALIPSYRGAAPAERDLYRNKEREYAF